MQHYFDPTRWNMEDDLNILKMEDDINLFQMEDNLIFDIGNLGSWFLVCNIVSTQLEGIWKYGNGKWHQFLKMEVNHKFLFKWILFINQRWSNFIDQMEDDLNILVKGRRPP